jgi:hypothetical protein
MSTGLLDHKGLWDEEGGLPWGVEQISQELRADSQKMIKDGQLLILRDGKVYNAQGALVK